jgi:hypothetical protein
LNVSTRPNIIFSEDGLCPPCKNYIPESQIDWDKRKEQLEKIIAFAKEKEHLGLKPLLVSMNYPPEQMSQNGADNLSNLIQLGFDCINISCSPVIWRNSMRHAFLKFGNWAKATELALFASVPRLAIAYQIPLIWWGENAAAVLGDLAVMGKDLSDGNRLKYSNTLQGGNLDWLLEHDLERSQLLQYIYPSDEEMERAQIRIVFMDYFMREFSHFASSNYSAVRGLFIRESNPIKNPDYFGTSMLDEDFINVNMFIRYLKFGFNRTTDLVNEEIRYGRMTRDEGIDLVTKYDGNYDPEIVEKFCEYIKIGKSEFWNNVDKHVNYELFEKMDMGKYIPKFKVGVGL